MEGDVNAPTGSWAGVVLELPFHHSLMLSAQPYVPGPAASLLDMISVMVNRIFLLWSNSLSLLVQPNVLTS